MSFRFPRLSLAALAALAAAPALADTPAWSVGADGMRIEDSAFLRVYLNHRISPLLQAQVFVARDTVSERHGAPFASTSDVRLEGVGAGLVLTPVAQPFFAEAGLALGEARLQYNDRHGRTRALDDRLPYAVAAAGYRHALSPAWSVHGLWSASVPLQRVDLRGDGASVDCDGPTFNRYCQKALTLQSQLRIGLEHRF